MNDIGHSHRCLKSICLLPSSLLADVLCWEFIDNQYYRRHQPAWACTHRRRNIGKKLGSCGLFGKSERYHLIGKSDLIESADSQVSSRAGKASGTMMNCKSTPKPCLEEMLGNSDSGLRLLRRLAPAPIGRDFCWITTNCDRNDSSKTLLETGLMPKLLQPTL